MATCSRCGYPIKFRYVNGRCIPLHLSGGCSNAISNNSTSNDYSGYTQSNESCCFLTSCPECGDETYFIRFNGGSVWIDPPLGPPWFKHLCMIDAQVKDTEKRPALIKNYTNGSFSGDERLMLGVVTKSEVSISKKSTITYIVTEKDDELVLLIKNSAGLLTGEMVIFDSLNQLLIQYDNNAYQYLVLNIIENSSKIKLSSSSLTCPECNCKINPKNLKKHLKKQHFNFIL